MKVVFVGRRNFMNHCFANWLAERHEVCAYFQADMNRYTRSYKRAWLRKRIKRYGLIRALDEALFQVYRNRFKVQKDSGLMREFFQTHFGSESLNPPPGVPYYEFPNLNSQEAVKTLETIKPDLVFAVCISQYLRKPYMEIPRLGTALYHEGLTPEYRGLHTAFWANYNGEPQQIGYTLLQINEKIDDGPPLAQGLGNIEPDLTNMWGYAGHKALVDGLPAVEQALAQLKAGQKPQVVRETGPARTYSYAGISDELRRRWRQRKKRMV